MFLNFNLIIRKLAGLSLEIEWQCKRHMTYGILGQVEKTVNKPVGQRYCCL